MGAAMPFIGAGLGIMQGMSEASTYGGMADTSRFNAETARAAAERDEIALRINQKSILADTLDAMQEEEMIGDAAQASTVATMGASGVVIEGGFIDVLRNESIKTQAKVNARGREGRNKYADITNKGVLAIHKHLVDASNYERQASVYDNQAKTAAIGSLLGGATGYTNFGGSFT